MNKKKIRLIIDWEFLDKVETSNIRSASTTVKTGIEDTIVMCTEFPNGEGYDCSFYGSTSGDTKKISLHYDDIQGLLACLEELNYFEDDTD